MKEKTETKSKLSIIWILFILAGLTLALNIPLAQASASYEPVITYKELTQLSTGHYELSPSIAFDHNDNLHVVWIGNKSANLYYTMLDSHGNTLINETCLDPNPAARDKHAKRASVAVDSDNNVHVVFHGRYTYEPWPNYTNVTDLDDSEVLYLKINPYLDDMDGNAANYTKITVIPEVIISTNDTYKSRAANIAVDSADMIHVVWFDHNIRATSGELHYLVMNKTGGIIIPETNVASGFYTDVDWGEPEIVVDSQRDCHVFFITKNWSDSGYDWRDIWYTMLNGATGNVLINSTQLTDSNETWRHVRSFVDIDSEDKIHIAWHDSRFYSNDTGEHEIFYMKIDPYLDDRNGNSADPETIKIIDEMLISENDYTKSYLTNIAVDIHNAAHIVWINDDTDDIYYAQVNATGNTVVPESRITTSALDFADWYRTSGRNPEIAVIDDLIFIVDMARASDTGNHDIWLTIFYADIEPPVISTPTRDPSGDVEEGQPVRIMVNVTDSQSGVNEDEVILSFTFDDGDSWFYTKMNYSSTLNLYEATIPRQFNCTWVKYKISASDNAGNIAVQENDMSYKYHVIPEFPSILPIAIFMMLSLLAAVFMKKGKRIIT